MKVNDMEITFPDEHCYAMYSGQMGPQTAYFGVDLEKRAIWATYNGEPGNAVPMYVYYGLVRRYRFPSVATNEWIRGMLKDPEFLKLFERLFDSASIYHDGNNERGVVDSGIEEEIEQYIDDSFDPETDSITIMDGDWWWDFIHRIVTPDMTDEEIQQIAHEEEEDAEKTYGEVYWEINLFLEMRNYRDGLRKKGD